MHPFEYSRVSDVAHALTSGKSESAKFIAGGTM
jgi:CO/xanthine dehydrogenase FAD-binding subunit